VGVLELCHRLLGVLELCHRDAAVRYIRIMSYRHCC